MGKLITLDADDIRRAIMLLDNLDCHGEPYSLLGNMFGALCDYVEDGTIPPVGDDRDDVAIFVMWDIMAQKIKAAKEREATAIPVKPSPKPVKSVESFIGGKMRQNGGIALDEDDWGRRRCEQTLVCPVCGFECSHITEVQRNDPRGWGGYGNASISLWGECGHSWTIFFNDHKGYVVASTHFDPSEIADRPGSDKKESGGTHDETDD